MRRVIAILVAACAVIFGTLAASPASASSGACGLYAPTQGRITTHHDGDLISVTAAFQLSQYQLDALRCTAPYLELSYTFYNVTIAADSENYSVYSNLPNATQDIGFEDTTFSPGITVIPASQLQADTPYYGTVTFHSGVTDTPYVGVDFSPSHWSSVTSIKEFGSCWRGDASNEAWCIFPTDTTILTEPYGSTVPVVDGGAYSYDPDLGNVA